MKGRVEVKMVWRSIPCVVEVPLEDGRKVRVPGRWKRDQFHPSWEQVAPEEVEQAKALLDRGVVVSFG